MLWIVLEYCYSPKTATRSQGAQDSGKGLSKQDSFRGAMPQPQKSESNSGNASVWRSFNLTGLKLFFTNDISKNLKGEKFKSQKSSLEVLNLLFVQHRPFLA